MTARFSLGIDLGTSNCAMALTDLDTDRTEIVPIPQILAANQLGEKPTLASALYLPHPEEFRPGSFPLPWDDGLELGIVGQFARDHGALVPDRLVTSAKSWLSNPHIDPKQRTLPWRSDSAEEKLSPFDCSRRYLQHLKGAFLQTAQAQGRQWDLGDGQIVVTVPASFDEVARSLTAEAAEAAGLGHVTLLEEPQAAFYAWAARAGRRWRDAVAPGDIILVCDVGGGTADFSLIAVTDVAGNLELERISVGEHILLGGDNMDLALAYTLQARLEAEGKSLDAWQFLALVHAAARAKITLFEDASLAEAPIAVPSRGSSLFAKTIATALDRASLSQVILDGFFAQTALDDLPREARRTGLQEFGLPYASDPVISKHLARFLTRSLQNVKASEQARRAGRGARRRARADADRRVVQWRRVQGRADPRPGAGPAGVLERRTGGPRAGRLRAGPRGRPGRRHLRAAPCHRQRHAHQGRRRALVLHRPGNLDAGNSRVPAAGQGALRRAAGHAGGHRAADRGSHVRPGDRRGRGIPVLLLRRAQRRHAGPDPARCRTRAGRDQPAGSRASCAARRSRGTGRAGADRGCRHGTRHARTLDEAHQLRPEMED